MRAHFFDLDTVLISDAMVWIVDKSKPSNCIMRITQSDFNLVRKGVYRTKGNKISFAGFDYFLPDNMMNDLRIRCKKMKSDISNLAFSMREFLDPEFVDSSNHTLDTGVLQHLKNTQDRVYFICSRNSENVYKRIIKKLEIEFSELGISPDYYYISDTFYERDDDKTSFDKIRLVLQHMIGFKSDGRKFTNDKIQQFSDVSFYDDDQYTIKLATQISDMLTMMVGNSESSIKEEIQSVIDSSKPELTVCLVSPNKISRFSSKKVNLGNMRLVKSFESYKYFGTRY